jgi:O-antigen/teichoic acid export membrane protein
MLGSVERKDAPDFLATVLAIFLGASLVIAIVVTIALHMILPSISAVLVVLTALAAISNAWFELNIVTCQARLFLKTYGALQAARSITALAGTLFILTFAGGVEALLGGYVIGNCVALVTAYNFRDIVRGRPRKAILLRIFHFGWPTGVASLSGISVTVQKFMLQAIGGSAALGIYSVANDFAGQSIGLLIGTAAITGQPLAFRARDNEDEAALVRQLTDNSKLIFTVAIGSMVGLIALAQPIARVCFGMQFHNDAWQLIAIASATAFVGGIRASIFEQGFEIVNNTRPLAVLPWVRVLCYLPLSAVLIRFAGSIGAGFAALATETLVFAITAVWVRRYIMMPIPWITIGLVSFAAACMAVSVQFTPARETFIGLAFSIGIGAVVYLGLCAFFLLPQMSRRMLQNAMSRAD